MKAAPPLRDRLLSIVLRSVSAIAGGVVLLIAAFLLRESWPGLRTIGSRFVSDPSWHPSPAASEGTFNLLPMLSGTLSATAGAVLLATPLGVLSAVFCHFYAPPRLATLHRRMVELLAGIPSVVYGLWGLTVLVPLVRRLQPPGASLLAGVLILSVMILPLVALSVDAALSSVPTTLLDGTAALGLSRWATIVGVVLPSVRSGLASGVLLETGRALGETMAVLMVCGNVVQHPGSLFDPVRTLTANIALEMAYALGFHRAALFVSGLALLGLVVAVVLLAETTSTREHG